MLTNKFLKSTIIGLSAASAISTYAIADDYEIDLSHSFIEFSTHHLGISVLKGRFNDFSGSFTTDSDSSKNSIEVTVQTTSIDSNWAARDKHLRSADFLDVSKFPTATFKSSSIEMDGNKVKIMGDFTLHGVTKSVTMMGEKIAEGKDPWGGYRSGFKADFSFNRSDYGVSRNLGPQAEKIDMALFIEGIRK